MSSFPQNNTNSSFTDVLSDGFKIFRNSYLKIILPMFIISLIPKILNVFLVTDLTYQLNLLIPEFDRISNDILNEGYLPTNEDMTILFQYFIFSIGILLIESIFENIFNVLNLCLFGMYLIKLYNNQNPDLLSEMKSSINKKILLPLLLLGLGIPVGFLMLFIPGIIIFGFFIFLVFIYNMEELNKPATQARRIAKGQFWRVIGVFIVNSIIIFAANFFYQSVVDLIWNVDQATYALWINPNSRNYAILIIYQAVYNLMNILFAPLFVSLLTGLFISIKTPLKDILTSQFPVEKKVSKEEEEKFKINSGMFCPFCGYQIDKTRKFCPNCGKSLEFT